MSEGIQSFRDLVAWQKAMDLTVEVYRVTGLLPAKEQYGLISQMTRAAVSVPANIAEGRGRAGSREFANFVSIARGSTAELETLLELAVRLRYVLPADIAHAQSLVGEVGRMLTTLGSRLRNPTA